MAQNESLSGWKTSVPGTDTNVVVGHSHAADELDDSDSDGEEVILFGAPSNTTEATATAVLLESLPVLVGSNEHELLGLLKSLTVADGSDKMKAESEENVRTLLILDLNGLLIDREFMKGKRGSQRTTQKAKKSTKGKNTNRNQSNKSPGTPRKADDSSPKLASHITPQRTQARNTPNTASPSKMVGNFLVSERPHLSEFLDFVFTHFDVAVWSSAQKHNVDALVNTVLQENHRSMLRFCWHNTMCTDAGVHPVHTHKNLFLKELSKVWETFKEYTSDNTLLLDDSVLKTQRNPIHTAVHPPEWSAAQTDDNELLVSSGDGLAGFLVRVVERAPGISVPMVVAQDPYAVLVNNIARKTS